MAVRIGGMGLWAGFGDCLTTAKGPPTFTRWLERGRGRFAGALKNRAAWAKFGFPELVEVIAVLLFREFDKGQGQGQEKKRKK